jgi:phosphate acyltransferase
VEVYFDTLGAEKGCGVVVDAGIRLFFDTSVNICLVGNKRVLTSYLRASGVRADSSFRIADTAEYVQMDEEAGDALSLKNDASILVAMRETACRKDCAVISPGHSGASILAAKTHWGLLPTIEKACLCQILPTLNGTHFVLADAGASLQANPVDLFYFAVMASAAANKLLRIEHPRIALLNIGSESSKGDLRLRNTYDLMNNNLPEFTGNIEGNDLWEGKADVVITDGITGNILIKSSEKLASFFLESFRRNRSAKSPDTLCDVLNHFSPSDYGGAVMLGVNGICVVCHGNASASELLSAAKLAVKCTEINLAETIEKALTNIGRTNLKNQKGDAS